MQDDPNILNPELEFDEDFDAVDADAAVEFPEHDPAFRPFARFADLLMEKKQLEARVEQIKKDMAGIQPLLLTHFQKPGTGPFTINSVTIFQKRDIYVRAKEKGGGARVIEALRASGLGHYVFETYNTRSLSAHVKELERQNKARLADGTIASTADLLPPAVAAVLNVEPTYTIQGRRKRIPTT